MLGKKISVAILFCCATLLLSACMKTEASPVSSTDGNNSETSEIIESIDSEDISDRNVDETELSVDMSFVPFVDTNAANLAYIEIVLDGLDAYREDGTFVEPERISDEDAAAVFELLQQISIDTPPLSRYTWAGSPDGGFGSIFKVYYYANSLGGEASYIHVIPFPVHLPDGELSGGIFFNSMCFQIDYELSSQLSSCYNELYKKYYPDIYAKWYPMTDEA